MSRYIDAQELLNWIKDSIKLYGSTYNADQLNMLRLFEEQIKNTPTRAKQKEEIKRQAMEK